MQVLRWRWRTWRAQRCPGTGQTDPQAQHLTLVRSGPRQMALNTLAIVTIVLGLVSFVLGMIVRNESSASAALHVTATVTGALPSSWACTCR